MHSRPETSAALGMDVWQQGVGAVLCRKRGTNRGPHWGRVLPLVKGLNTADGAGFFSGCLRSQAEKSIVTYTAKNKTAGNASEAVGAMAADYMRKKGEGEAGDRSAPTHSAPSPLSSAHSHPAGG